jgi:hypothetical protein
MDPDKLMDDIASELVAACRDMGRSHTVEEKLQYSQIILNLSDSLGVFLNGASDMMPYDFETDA